MDKPKFTLKKLKDYNKNLVELIQNSTIIGSLFKHKIRKQNSSLAQKSWIW